MSDTETRAEAVAVVTQPYHDSRFIISFGGGSLNGWSYPSAEAAQADLDRIRAALAPSPAPPAGGGDAAEQARFLRLLIAGKDTCEIVPVTAGRVQQIIAALASPAATGEPVGWIAYTQKGAFVAHITRRETAAEFSSDGFIVRGIYDIAPAQPGPSAEVRVKATLEALRVEAADDHFHDAWQQGVRYAISEVLDALATDAEG